MMVEVTSTLYSSETIDNEVVASMEAMIYGRLLGAKAVAPKISGL
jgi:hypothetical protein